MATGLRRTIEGGHDVIYDYCCTTCEGENLNADALFYCKDCRQLFCEPCKKSHDKFFKTHTVLGKKDVAKWGDVKPLASSLMCDEHPGKELEMYCEDHGCVCCHICISVEHRTCQHVEPVSQVSIGIKTKSEYKSFLSEAAQTQSRLKTLYAKQKHHIKMLQKARSEITSTFKNMRKKLNQIVDRLEVESTTELDRLLTMFEDQVTLDKNACLDIQEKIQTLLGDIQSLGKRCDELAFKGYKKCSEQIAFADRLLSSVQDVDYQLKFIPDVKINQYLSALVTLGSFHVSPTGLAHVLQNSKKTNSSTTSYHVYSVVNKQTYNVKTSGDTLKCSILGICQLPNGQTAIVDSSNLKVKLLSTYTYCVLDELKLPPCPCNICPTTGTEMAVTVCDGNYKKYIRKEIRFINAVDGNLFLTRTIQLDHECGGIAYHNALLYVCSHTALYVYNLSGKIKKLYEDTSGNLTVYRICLSDDGSRIYVTNYDKRMLLTLDSSGHLLSTLRDPELQDPAAVCVAGNGSVFVSGGESFTVLQVDREGRRKMTTVSTLAEEACFPNSVCYDRKTDTLLLGHLSNILLALKLE